ncbi:MAG: hypothetical protein BalsKO_13320 [Balneolaceae bacterium]
MKLSATYRFLSAILCVTFFIGLITPVFGHTEIMEHCSTSMSHDSEGENSEHQHTEMNDSMNMDSNCCSDMKMDHGPMEDPSPLSDTCEMAIDCICDFTHSAVKTDALLITKAKSPILFVSESIDNLNPDLNYSPPVPIKFTGAYSPPLLYLTNESFLI